jgi:hypothetical protein
VGNSNAFRCRGVLVCLVDLVVVVVVKRERNPDLDMGEDLTSYRNRCPV